MTVLALAIAGRRVSWLYRLLKSGQPAPGRLDGIGQRAKDQLLEVFGQRKLLKWNVSGAAHFFMFWGFVVLAATIVEAYGALFDRDFAIPLIGHWPVLGFLEDFFAVAVLVALAVFSVIRLRNAPARRQRASRFYGSHTGAAWLVLFMIFNVIWTLLLYRGAQINTGVFPFESGAFASEAVAEVLEPLGEDTNEILETIGILAQIGVVLGFLVLVVYSKHLHIFLAPLNVLTKREPAGARPAAADDLRRQADRLRGPGRGRRVRPRQGRGLHLEGDARLLDLHRVRALPGPVPGLEHRQAAVPQARDHGPARPPVREGAGHPGRRRCGGHRHRGGRRRERRPRVDRPAPRRTGVRFRPHPGEGRGAGGPPARRHRGRGRRHRPRRAVVLYDVWCLRRAVPGRHRARRPHHGHASLPGADRVVVPLRGRHDAEEPGDQGQPVGHERAGPPGLDRGPRLRGPRRRREDVHDLSEVDYLYWVGCAGALEDRAKKTTRAFAELLHIAGVRFAVLGEAEACSGDPARRLGNEFVFQMLAQQNVETLNEAKADHDRRDLPALLQQPGPGVPAGRRQVRRRAPHPAAAAAGRRGPADPDHADRRAW